MVLAAAPSCLSAPDSISQWELEQQWLFQGQEFRYCEDRQWWVFYTKSRQEKALTRHLSSRRIPHYLPLQEVHSLSRGRRLTSLMPVFSGYVFLYADREERIAALQSNRVARTIDVLPSRQDELVSDLIRIQRLIESGKLVTLEALIQPGQRVRVKCGRLVGLEGTVTTRRGVSRLFVAINYLQQGASVEVDDFTLEVI